MICEKPFIHLFKSRNFFYLYDVNKNAIINIKGNIFKILENQLNETANDQLLFEQLNNKSINDLISKGFLSSNRVSCIEHPYNEMIEHYLHNGLRAITLQVTQQCNFRCEYCGYSETGQYQHRKHTDISMSLDVIKKGIDFLYEHSQDSPSITIGFYGGEPMLEINKIRYAIDYAEGMFEGKIIIFTMTTNASLLTEDIIQYFIEHNLKLVISIDGPKEIHDKNRKFAYNNSGTYDCVIGKIKMIKDKFPDYYKEIVFSVVIDPFNDFSCTNSFFLTSEELKESILFPSSISPDYRNDKMEVPETYFEYYNYELFKLLLYRLNKLDKKYISSIMNAINNIIIKVFEGLKSTYSLPDKAHPGGPCVPAIKRLFMDVNGDLFPCERVSESSNVTKIGNIYEGFDIKKVRSILNIGKVTEEKCINCWAFRFCSSCIKYSDSITGISQEKRSQECHKIKHDIQDKFINFCVLVEHGDRFVENPFEIINTIYT